MPACRCGCGQQVAKVWAKGHNLRKYHAPQLPPLVLSDFDLGWVVGLLEGEGSFYVTERKKANGWTKLVKRVTLTTTDRDVALRFQRLAGGSLARFQPSGKPTWKLVYKVVLETARAERVLDAVYEHLGERRRAQIDELAARLRAA